MIGFDANAAVTAIIKQHCYDKIDELRTIMKSLVEEETAEDWWKLFDVIGNINHQQNTLLTFGGEHAQLYSNNFVKKKRL